LYTSNVSLLLIFFQFLLIATPAMATGSGAGLFFGGVICLLTLPLKWVLYAGVLKNTPAYVTGEYNPRLHRSLIGTRITIGAVLFTSFSLLAIIMNGRNPFHDSYFLLFGTYLASSSLSWVITFALQSRPDRNPSYLENGILFMILVVAASVTLKSLGLFLICSAFYAYNIVILLRTGQKDKQLNFRTYRPALIYAISLSVIMNIFQLWLLAQER